MRSCQVLGTGLQVTQGLGHELGEDDGNTFVGSSNEENDIRMAYLSHDIHLTSEKADIMGRYDLVVKRFGCHSLTTEQRHIDSAPAPASYFFFR